MDVLKTLYWDKWRADEINSQSIANILVDWVWASGSYGIKLPQKMLGVEADGIAGPITLAVVNNYPDQQELFGRIKQERIAFVDRIVKSRPANAKFRRGWLNRINSLEYQP
jgi:lysozyme family protein